MLHEWQAVAAELVRLEVQAVGGRVRGRRVANTGTIYVQVEVGGHRGGVRLSDHRPRRGMPGTLLSIRQQAPGRLSQLRGYLARLASGQLSPMESSGPPG